MTTAKLNEVIERLGRLPSEKQDAIAALVIEELASEELWDSQFARSQDMLDQLADAALAEDASGET